MALLRLDYELSVLVTDWIKASTWSWLGYSDGWPQMLTAPISASGTHLCVCLDHALRRYYRQTLENRGLMWYLSEGQHFFAGRRQQYFMEMRFWLSPSLHRSHTLLQRSAVSLQFRAVLGAAWSQDQIHINICEVVRYISLRTLAWEWYQSSVWGWAELKQCTVK